MGARQREGERRGGEEVFKPTNSSTKRLNNPSSRAQESTKENRIHHKQSTRRTRLKRNQTPRGHKEGRASFPDQFPYKSLKNPYSKPYPREEREEEKRKGRRRTGEAVLGLCASQGKRERERAGVGIFMPTNSRTKRLNYP